MQKMLVLFLLFPIIAYTSVVKHEQIGALRKEFSYEEFCTEMKAKSNLFVSTVGAFEIECFNEKFKINDFCLKKLPLEAQFTRGYGVNSEKKVFCEEAESIILTLTCENCSKAHSMCTDLKKSFAYRLELNHASRIDGKINCYYSKKIGENLYENLENL